MYDKDLLNSQICKGKCESPIDDNKLENCYEPNGEIYPLCSGQEGNHKCKECNVYEEMVLDYES